MKKTKHVHGPIKYNPSWYAAVKPCLFHSHKCGSPVQSRLYTESNLRRHSTVNEFHTYIDGGHSDLMSLNRSMNGLIPICIYLF